MKSSIYCFTNLINNKKYIGSTIQEPKVRYNQHIYNMTHETAHQYNYPLYQAIRKYGLENFTFEIIFEKECSEEEIRKIEKEYIIKYNSLSPDGYNQTLDTSHPINDIQSYKKMSETKRKKAKEVVEVITDKKGAVIEIISKWRSIIDCAESTGLDEKKIASVCRGERKTTGGRTFYWIDENNKILVPEYKRDEYKGEKGTTQVQSSSRKVAKINLETNEIIDTYATLALAARENNCDSSAISKVCRGVRKKCGGFKWKYIDNL